VTLVLQSAKNPETIEYSIVLDGDVIKTKSLKKRRYKSINQGGRGKPALRLGARSCIPLVAASVWKLPQLGTNVYEVKWHRAEPKQMGKDEFHNGRMLRQWVGVARA
jgi:hypothetical protein